MQSENSNTPEWQRGFATGRRHGIAIASVVVAAISFVSLLGAEKALIAILLGWVALRGAPQQSLPRRLGIIAVTLGCVFLATAGTMLAIFWDDVVEFIELLNTLS